MADEQAYSGSDMFELASKPRPLAFGECKNVETGPIVYDRGWNKLCSRHEMPNVTPGEIVDLHGHPMMVSEIKHGFVFFTPIEPEAKGP